MFYIPDETHNYFPEANLTWVRHEFRKISSIKIGIWLTNASISNQKFVSSCNIIMCLLWAMQCYYTLLLPIVISQYQFLLYVFNMNRMLCMLVGCSIISSMTIWTFKSYTMTPKWTIIKIKIKLWWCVTKFYLLFICLWL